MLDLQGSRPRWASAFILLALAGCAGAGSEGDEPGPPSPPGEILTVPTKKENGGTRAGKAHAAPALSRADYISRADILCARSQAQIHPLETAAELAAKEGDFEAAADRLERGVAESDKEVAELRDLYVPRGSEAILSRIYAGIEEANRVFRGSLDELRSGDVKAFNRIGDQARLASVPSKRSAIAFGFEVCGRGN